jgi:lysophospholipase L1-like esterase
VVIGDSIPHPDFCPTCTGFVVQYAKQLETSLGRPVIVANRSRNDGAGIPQIKAQVVEDQALREEIAEAEFVIVSVGFNSIMPDATLGTGCTGEMGETDATYAAWLLTTDDACVQAGIDAWAPDYDTIFSTIAGLRPDKPTLRVALNAYDGNIDWIQNADVPPDVVAPVERLLTTIYDRFNPMLCDRATTAGFTCLDIYHAFSGTGENRSLLELTIDGAHPNQAGGDLIASMLAELDTSAVVP